MGIDDYYATGTIKVKNADGELVPFVPKTSTDNVYSEGEVSLSATISEFNTRITEAAQKGGVKVMYEEPTAENTADFANKTLIGWVEPETWSYTVDTRLYDNTETNAKTSIPFDLYNVNNASIKVDWGDNTTSTFTSSDYSSSSALNNTSSTGLIHTYLEPGIYTIKVISNFDKVKLYNSSFVSENTPIYYWIKTLTEVNNAFPTLNVTSFAYCFQNCSSLTSIPTGLFDNNTVVNDFYRCFYYCTSLTTIPADLFKYNTAATSFSGCFYYCTSLTTIPADLFKYNTAVTGFSECFMGCSSLTTIPADLFKYNTAVTGTYNSFYYTFANCSSITTIPADLFKYNTEVTDFSECFMGCSSLTTIPADLFKYNTAVTNFSYCFQSCSSLTTISQDLFKYNVNVINVRNCFSNCSSLNGFTIHIGSTKVSTVTSFVTKKTGVTRTVYVPTGSTTKTKFDSVASSLGLTIIGE